MTEKKKEKSQGFAAFGIPVGSVLVYKKDPGITVKTLDGKNKVEYQGRPYSISTLAKQFVGSPVSGYLYFKYGDKILKNLARKEAEPAAPDTESAAVKVSDSAESGEGKANSETESEIDPPEAVFGKDSGESAANEAAAGK